MSVSSRQGLQIILVGDILSIALTVAASIFFFSDYRLSEQEWGTLFGFVVLWMFIGYWRRLHDYGFNKEMNFQIINHVKAYSAYIVVVSLFHLLFDISVKDRISMLSIVIGYPLIGFVINALMVRLVWRTYVSTKNTKSALVAGIGSVAQKIEEQIHARQIQGYEIKGFISCDKSEQAVVQQNKVIGSLEDMNEYLKDNPVDEIVIALPVVRHENMIQNIISTADYHGVRVKYILDYQNEFGKNYKISRFGEVEALTVRQLPLDGILASLVKNTFDKVFSLLALTLLSPMLIIIAILIKLDSRGPVFYCPVRIGKGGKPFKLYKFRSMVTNDATAGGTLSTQKNDPRITRLGRILRKYSLDELPQFINVFFGTMSVVGPRPHRRYLNQQMQQNVHKYMVRHYVKPGITGWAQVNGWRGPTETEEQKMQRTQHDLWYIENWSLWLDIKIILLTIFGKKTHLSAF